MGTLLAWVALLLIPACCLAAMAGFGALLGNGPLTLLLAAFVGITAPLIGARWLSERIRRPRRS